MKVDEGFMHVWEEPTEAGRLHNPHPCREGGCVSADTPDTPALEGKVPRLDPQTHAKKWHRVLSLLLQLAGSKKCEGLEKLDHFDLHSVWRCEPHFWSHQGKRWTCRGTGPCQHPVERRAVSHTQVL